METISIQLPAALYSSIYERYQEETSTIITACLSKLLEHKAPEETQTEVGENQYQRPGVGTKTGRVWEVADYIHKETGTVNREEVIKACMQEGINVNTASTQYSHWRKANPKK